MKIMAGLRLKLPTIPVPTAAVTDKNESETSSSANVARFISDGDRRPASAKTLPKNFRLQQVFIDILDEGAASTGLGQTDILKAALAAFQQMDENQKNYWILESKKL